jgi:hypothetical protein
MPGGRLRGESAFRWQSLKLRAAQIAKHCTGLIDLRARPGNLVVDDLALRNPLRDAQPERFPHVDADRFDAFPLRLTS